VKIKKNIKKYKKRDKNKIVKNVFYIYGLINSTQLYCDILAAEQLDC